MTDLVVRTYLQELTAAFLENGFADIRDKRKEAGLVTPDCLLWRECLSEAGLGEDCAVTERYGRCICCSRQQASVLSYHNGALKGISVRKTAGVYGSTELSFHGAAPNIVQWED